MRAATRVRDRLHTLNAPKPVDAMSALMNAAIARPAVSFRAPRVNRSATGGRQAMVVRAAARDTEAAKAAVVGALVATLVGAPLMDAAPAFAVTVRSARRANPRLGPPVASAASHARRRRTTRSPSAGTRRAAPVAAPRAPRRPLLRALALNWRTAGVARADRRRREGGRRPPGVVHHRGVPHGH